MIVWSSIDENLAKNIWNRNLINFDGFTYDQLFEWGEYKRESGWLVIRLLAHNSENNIVAMSQCLYKKLPLGYCLLWIPGGPVGDFTILDDRFIDVVKNVTACSKLYFRALIPKMLSSDDVSKMESAGWASCKTKLRSGTSMALDLNKSDEEFKKNLSKDWKRSLNKAGSMDIKVSLWDKPDIHQMLSVYESMQKYKQLSTQFSEEEIRGIFKYINNNIIIFRCDHDNKLVAFRGCIYLNNFAWDLFAATTPEARKLYASYELLVRLIQACKNAGIKYYELMGVDLENNEGVYHFKKGTGARLIEYLGEWEWSNSLMLSKISDFIVNRKVKNR